MTCAPAHYVFPILHNLKDYHEAKDGKAHSAEQIVGRHVDLTPFGRIIMTHSVMGQVAHSVTAATMVVAVRGRAVHPKAAAMVTIRLVFQVALIGGGRIRLDAAEKVVDYLKICRQP